MDIGIEDMDIKNISYPDMIYPREERGYFINREDILSKLEYELDRAKKGELRVVGLIGVRRCGKTLVIKEFLRRIWGDKSIVRIYMDFESFPEDPLDFVNRFFSWVVYWILTGGAEYPERFFSVDLMSRFVEGFGNKILSEALRDFIFARELDSKIRIALRPIVHSEKPVVLILDELQDCLESLSKAGIDFLGILREIVRSRTLIILSGSIRNVMDEVLSDYTERFFLQASRLDLGPFNLRDVWSLVERIWGKSIKGKIAGRILRFSGGFPFYVYAISDRALELSFTFGGEPEEHVEIAYFDELLSTRGRIYSHCQYLWKEYLKYARRKKYLRRLLEILALKGPMTLSQLSSELNVSPNILQKYTEELVSLGIVTKFNNEYTVFNSSFATWILARRELPEISVVSPKNRTLIEKLRELEKRISRIESIAGKFFEKTIQVLISQLLGRKIDANTLGETQLGKVAIPPNIRQNPTKKLDGQVIEADAILYNSETWLIEITLKKLTPRKILDTMRSWKADIYWFITYQGATSDALTLAKKHTNIIISTKKHITELYQKIL